MNNCIVATQELCLMLMPQFSVHSCTNLSDFSVYVFIMVILYFINLIKCKRLHTAMHCMIVQLQNTIVTALLEMI